MMFSAIGIECLSVMYGIVINEIQAWDEKLHEVASDKKARGMHMLEKRWEEGSTAAARRVNECQRREWQGK